MDLGERGGRGEAGSSCRMENCGGDLLYEKTLFSIKKNGGK